MNIMIGHILEFGATETKTFWIAKYFVNKMNLSAIWTGNLQRVAWWVFAIEVFIQNYIPKVWK